jgi:hypothetical protein
MLRFGVCSPQQLYANQLNDVFGKEKNISIELYEDLNDANGRDRQDYQEIVLGRFKFGHVFKRTYAKRFTAFDQSLICAVRKHFGENRKEVLTIHDAAASDGRTSLELYNELTGLYKDRLLFLGTDILPWVYSVHKPRGHLKAVLNDDGQIIQLIYPPFVFDCGRVESRFYWINRIILRCLQKQGSELSALFLNKSSNVLVRKIFLIHTQCRELLKRKNNFTFERHNILEPIERQFDLVRAMNILNLRYFSPEEIRHILRSVFFSLREGGLFATGSNENPGSEVDGGIYLKMAYGFELFCDSLVKSKVHDLIVGFNSG